MSAFRSAALAAAGLSLALLAVAAPAAAANVSTTGNASPAIAPAPTVNLPGVQLLLGGTIGGIGQTGALNVSAGGNLTVGEIDTGFGGLGNGSALVTGAGSIVTIVKGALPVGGLDAGSWGTGTITVDHGGVITCTAAVCPNIRIGSGAGSVGTLTIDGTGSRITGLAQVTVAGATVVAGFGTPGGTTHGTLEIKNGGVLATTGFSVVSPGGSGALANGLEQTMATVTIDGAGSKWEVTRATGGSQAQINVASAANASAIVDVTNGGQIVISGSRVNPATDSSVPGMTIGGTATTAGGSGTVNVDGAGSAIVINGDTGFINVGRNGAIDTSLSITNGAQVYGGTPNGLVNMNVARAGSTSSLLVDGPQSKLTLSGTCGVNSGCDGHGAFLSVGRDPGSHGTATVSNGGAILLSDGGQAASTGGGLGIVIGFNTGNTGTGLVSVSGASSSVTVEQLGNGAQTPFINVGDGGTGTLAVSDGAHVNVNGPLQRNINVGVNPGGNGTLTASTGAVIGTSFFAVGNDGGTGHATFDNASLMIDGVVLNPLTNTYFGGSVRVGRGTGSAGTLDLVNGAQITLDSTTAGSAINLGGTNAGLGGDGTLNMSGGSSISFVGSGTSVNIGHSGTGLFTMTGASTLSMPNDGIIVLGNRAGGDGTLQLGGGSTIDTGFLTVGNNGHGSVQMTGGTLGVHGTDPNTDAFFVVGANSGAVGTVSQSGGVVSVDSSLILGWQTGSNGTYTLSGGTLNTGNLTVGDRGAAVFINSAPVAVSTTNNVTGLLIIGGDPSSNSSYTITGNNAQTNVSFAPGGIGPTDPPGLNGFDPVTMTNRPAPNGALGVGIGGTGTFTQGAANFSDPGNIVNVAGDLAVGVFAGGVGTYTLNTGTLTVGGKIVIGGQSQGANVFTQNGGSVAVTGAAFGNPDYVGLGGNDFSGSLTVGGGINDLGGGTGTYVLNGGTVTASLVQVGLSGTGTFNQTGGTVTTPTLWLGNCGGCNGGNASGTYNLTGTGVINASSESIGLFGHGEFTQNGAATRNNVAGTLAIGDGPKIVPDLAVPPRSGSYTLIDGQLNTQNTIAGSQGVGTFVQSGGLHTVASDLTIGRDNPTPSGNSGGPAIGTYTQTGGLVTIGSAYNGQVLANGQTVSTAAAGTLTVGAAGNGTYNIGTSGQTNNVQWGGYPGNSPGTPPPAFNNTTNAPYVQVFGNVVVGRDSGSTGVINLAGTGSTLAVTGTVIIGDAGTGTFTQNGGTHTIGDALILGNQASGNGTYVASNGASVVLTGASATARVVVGNQGTGTLIVEGGSTVSLPSDGSVIVGAAASGIGTLFVLSGATMNAGSLLGIGHDGTQSNGAKGTVILDGGANIFATSIRIGAGGCLGGNGTVHGSVVMDGETIGDCDTGINPTITANGAGTNVGGEGFLKPGRSPGTLVIDGAFQFISGTIVLEVESCGLDCFLTDEIIFTYNTVLDLTKVNVQYLFLGNTDPNAFAASSEWVLDTFFKTIGSTGQEMGISALGPLDTLFADATFTATSAAYVIEDFTFDPATGVDQETFNAVPVASVPEPSTFWLMLIGSLLLLRSAPMRRLAASTRRK